MPKVKKRPTKNAKAAKKAVKGSELLAAKTARDVKESTEFNTSVVTPRTSTAIKPRPDKKRG
jgi:hypothetical protein